MSFDNIFYPAWLNSVIISSSFIRQTPTKESVLVLFPADLRPANFEEI
jgi:hypothetical protein